MANITMKALRINAGQDGKPGLAFETIPRPILAPNTALVEIKATAINPSDIMNAKGGFPQTQFPRTPGRDYAGVIVDGPSHLINKEVYGTSGKVLGFLTDGTHAQYCVVPLEGISPKPSTISFAQAATVGTPFTTAALALRRANLQPSDTILILGASGAVGSAARQLAQAKGCKVLSGGRGASSDVNTASDPEMKAAKTLTGGKGPDVVFDTTGSPALMKAGLLCLAPRGRLTFISAPKSGSTEFTFDLKAFYRDEKVIVGSNTGDEELADTKDDMVHMVELFDSGKLQVISEDKIEKIPIEKGLEAYESLGSGGRAKYVIVF